MFGNRIPPTLSFEITATLAVVESLHGTLSVARALVTTGRTIDLTGLDQEAARLCAAVACLPDGSGQALLGPLEALTREIDLLAASLPLP